jgi:hypothetical protein
MPKRTMVCCAEMTAATLRARYRELLPPTTPIMSSRRWKSFASAAAIALLAGCSDSSTQPEADLTTAQLHSMVSALGTLLGTSLGIPEPSASSLSQLNARMDYESAYSRERTCPEEGRLGVGGNGSVDSLGALHLVTTDTLADCGIKNSQGEVWRFTTKPVIATSLEVGISNLPNVEIAQTDVGRVHFSSGSLSGTCSIDVSIGAHMAIGSPTPDSATTSIHSEGTVCGHSVSEDTVITSLWAQP